jgi:environmental stress-induced protein Ves
MNTIQIIQADEQPPQPWRNGGGQTRELLVWPTPTNWQLRISRADIAASGPFSAFAGVQRWFVVLSGNGVVLHMPTGNGHALDHHLLPGHAPLRFDGGLAPGCTLLAGPTQDLNLMARGGEACVEPWDADRAWSCQFAMGGIYTLVAGTWSQGVQSRTVPANSLLWQHQADPEPMHFSPEHPVAARGWWLGFSPEQNV